MSLENSNFKSFENKALIGFEKFFKMKFSKLWEIEF